MSDRAFPKVVVRRDVVCQSSRNGVKPLLIVIHSAEDLNIPHSARDLEGLAAFFDRLPTQASSHVATDGDGQSSRMVDDDKKAWSCVHFNSLSLNIEQVGKAALGHWSAAEVDETARWVAYFHRHHGIPIRHGAVRAGGVIHSGVVRHSELGIIGGGHTDPGTPYPFARMLRRAQRFHTLQERG